MEKEVKQGIISTPIFLIGNKSDLSDKREISAEEGKSKAKEYKYDCLFLETSFKDRENVNESFLNILKKIVEFKIEINGIDLYEVPEKDGKESKDEDCCKCLIC